LSQVKQVGGTSFYTAKGYNVMNQLNGISFGNGVATTFGYYTTTKRLKQILTTATGSITIQSFINRYDAVGNVIGLQDQVSSHTNAASATISSAVYDDLNRLTTATWSGYGTKTYGYNSVGNVLTNGESGVTNYVYGSIRPHAVRSANGTWFTYDQNGNAVFRGGQRLDYNVNNHLYRVINTNGVVTTFGYDANGARLWEQSSTNTLQVWIGNNYEEKNGQTLYHILANSQTVCTFDKTGTNVFEYYHPDYLTSTSLQTDKNGNQLQHYEYSAFGQTRYTQSTNVFKVSRLYTGQVLDDSTGLYYYNFRYYDPILARFMQPDDIIQDIFNPQTYNRYSYCVNNPLRFTDPSGHDPTYAMFFANSSIQNEVAVSRTLAPYAVGAIVATATAGVATPLLVSAGASTTFAAVGSGVIAGATGDLVSQGTQIGLGQRKSISGQEVAVSSLAGGALSGAASKLALLKATPGATPEATPTVTPQGQVANAAKTIPSKVDNLVSQIEQSGAKVKLNPKTANQEGNVTLDFGKDGRINIRVETHSLEPNGTPVRHANVETVTEIGGKKTVDNTHITQ
jgi:RHS repeat-associated protein